MSIYNYFTDTYNFEVTIYLIFRFKIFVWENKYVKHRSLFSPKRYLYLILVLKINYWDLNWRTDPLYVLSENLPLSQNITQTKRNVSIQHVCLNCVYGNTSNKVLGHTPVICIIYLSLYIAITPYMLGVTFWHTICGWVICALLTR